MSDEEHLVENIFGFVENRSKKHIGVDAFPGMGDYLENPLTERFIKENGLDWLMKNGHVEINKETLRHLLNMAIYVLYMKDYIFEDDFKEYMKDYVLRDEACRVMGTTEETVKKNWREKISDYEKLLKDAQKNDTPEKDLLEGKVYYEKEAYQRFFNEEY